MIAYGLLITVAALLIHELPNTTAAFSAMIVGGVTTITLLTFEKKLLYGLAANNFEIFVSIAIYIIINYSKHYKFKHYEI